MKFALLGYGKMGKQIETMLLQNNQEIVATIDNEQDWHDKLSLFMTADVAIDFSMPSVAVANMQRAFESHIPIVVGTTGWYDKLNDIRVFCEKHNGSLVYGSNFSIGANLFMQLNNNLAAYMNQQPQYDVRIEETHHETKKDAPSGTAIHLAEDILRIVQRLNQWQLTDEASANESVIPVKANRIGTVPGIHKITWHSEEDDIEIIHTAHSRRGFAAGAIKAAEWLTKNPGIYEFQKIALHLNQ